MKQLFITLAATIVAVSLLIVGCSQAAPAQPAASKAAEPTKPAAPAAAPTQAPAPTAAPTKTPELAKQVDFPQKGKAISILIPWPTGGGNDLTARVLAAGMEKDLGTPVQVVNKPGAGSQVGLAEGAAAKPDGYTLVNTAIPNSIGIYLEPERKATFDRKSFIPVALHTLDPITVAVNAKSPYKTVKELIDYAKANPGKLKAGTGGLMGVQHLAILLFQKATGARFSIVHFDGGAQQVTNLLGEHIDVVFDFPPSVLPQVKSGNIRALGVLDTQEFKYLPGVPTLPSQGYNINFSTARIFSVPAGTPKEVVNILSGSIKRVIAMEDQQKRLDEMGIIARYMDSAEASKYWEEKEAEIAPLIPLAKQQ